MLQVALALIDAHRRVYRWSNAHDCKPAICAAVLWLPRRLQSCVQRVLLAVLLIPSALPAARDPSAMLKLPPASARAPHTHRTLPAASIHTTARAARKKRCPNWRSWATAPEPPNLKHKLRHATTGQHGRGAQINSTYNEKGIAKTPVFDAMSLISISRRCLVFLGHSTLWFDVHGRVAWLI